MSEKKKATSQTMGRNLIFPKKVIHENHPCSIYQILKFLISYYFWKFIRKAKNGP